VSHRTISALLLAVTMAALGTVGAHPAAAGGPPRPRSVIVHQPARHGPVGVVVLHGLGGSPERQAQVWNATADRYGFTAIYPSAAGPDRSWNAGQCCGTSARVHRDDVGYLDRVISVARARYGVRTVYLAGFSNGGMLAYAYACARPWAIPAVYIAASTYTRGRPCPGYTGRALHEHGQLDQIIPPGGMAFAPHLGCPLLPVLAIPGQLSNAQVTVRILPGRGHSWMVTSPATAWAFFGAGR